MKKLIIAIVLFTITFVLTSCSSGTTLPDIENLTYNDARTILREEGISYYKIDVETTDASLIDIVAGYSEYESADKVKDGDLIAILVYVYGSDVIEYFETIDIDYDGPYLDDVYKDVSYIDPRGGYFEVTLKSCTDGDTARFNYPTDIYELITSSAKSVRFLNMDTEETFTDGEEEWGKPASVYTCSLLTSATSIVIQTDPGSGVTDTYGRLLAWIWIQLPGEDEYQLLNYMVVQQGLAQVKYVSTSPYYLEYEDVSYSEWMYQAEDYAKVNLLGQWGTKLDYYWDYENNKANKELWD